MDASTAPAAAEARALYDFAARLYPICRSITGAGVRQTLGLIRARIPLQIHEVPTGTRVFDWEVPEEWNMEDAAVLDPDGRRVVDFQAHNLHLVSYSEPIQASMSLAGIEPAPARAARAPGLDSVSHQLLQPQLGLLHARARACGPAPRSLPRRGAHFAGQGIAHLRGTAAPGPQPRGSPVLHAYLPPLAGQ